MARFKKLKIVAAMSGGIDSSVAAALLKKADFEVIGVFMRLVDSSSFKESERKVKKIAKILEIPVLVLDLRKEFRKKIIDYFVKELRAGRTPNPCVLCNKEIKFKILLKKAREIGVNFVATGHYALKREIKSQKSKIMYRLLKAKDGTKDQSYFLWTLSQKQLRHILFPIGNYTKTEVRNLARNFNLPIYKGPESQEICFIETTINDFIAKRLKQKPGAINNIKGETIGEHQGLAFYTIGQRKGIGLSGGPYYVLDKDIKKNILIVTKKERDLYKKELIVKNVNWVSGKQPKLPLRIKAKIRYRCKAAAAVFKKQKVKKRMEYKVIFDKGQRAITLGQSVVFYKNREVFGGGTIK